MTTERQQAANKANAKASTGPRTEAGKKRSAKNARRHGLTTPPNAEDILVWTRIILGEAEIALERELVGSERYEKARDLAIAEADLRRAIVAERKHNERRLKDFEVGVLVPAPGDIVAMFRDENGSVCLELSDACRALARQVSADDMASDREGRLIKRYLTAAQNRRDRAFAEWTAWLECKANSSKRSQNQP